MKNILLVIDMQKGFIKEKKNFISKIKKHLDTFNYDDIIFTKFINKSESNFVKRLKWNGMTSEPSTDIVEELKEYAEFHTIEKNTYSVLKSKQFVDYFKEQNKENIKFYICGVDTDACILATAFEFFDMGYNFEIIRDLITSSNINLHFHTEEIIKRNINFKES